MKINIGDSGINLNSLANVLLLEFLATDLTQMTAVRGMQVENLEKTVWSSIRIELSHL